MIPFNKASLSGAEMRYLAEAVQNGHISGNGPFTRKCQEYFQSTLGVPRALLTTSCTHALEMSALLLDIRSGDEVIFPSFTFVSTVNAFVLRGARPVFADIRPDTLNLNEQILGNLITERTKAIVVVHYAGVGCELNAIMDIAARRSIPVVEDNAHGLFGKYRSRFLGTFGCLATLSFHETKNFTCGEGGALFINDEIFAERAEIIWEKGTNRSQFFRGHVDKYSWVDVGSSYLPSDLLAAFLLAQLENREAIQAGRAKIWQAYRDRLGDWAAAHGIGLPIVPADCEQAFHMFYLVMPSLDSRQRFMAFMRSRGILAIFHYLPLHLSPMGLKYGGKPGDCPVTESVSDRIVRLPFFNSLSESDQDCIIESILAFTP